MMTGWVPLAPARVTVLATGADRPAATDCAAPPAPVPITTVAAAGPAPAVTASAEHTPAATSAPEMTLPLPRIQSCPRCCRREVARPRDGACPRRHAAHQEADYG